MSICAVLTHHLPQGRGYLWLFSNAYNHDLEKLTVYAVNRGVLGMFPLVQLTSYLNLRNSAAVTAAVNLIVVCFLFDVGFFIMLISSCYDLVYMNSIEQYASNVSYLAISDIFASLQAFSLVWTHVNTSSRALTMQTGLVILYPFKWWDLDLITVEDLHRWAMWAPTRFVLHILVCMTSGLLVAFPGGGRKVSGLSGGSWK